MGHKTRPRSLRMGILKNWSSSWFPKKLNFKISLEEDVLIRKEIENKISVAGIDKISIEKAGDNYRILIKASRPGLIIGRGGKGVEDLTQLLGKKLKLLRKKRGITVPVSLSLNIEELKRTEVSARIIAQNIAWDLEKRMPFRRLMKKYLDQIMQNKEVKGSKIRLAGRLNGAEIARSEHLERGSLPLQTLRANIDEAQVTAFTTYGTIGVKVWVYKGEIF